MLQKVVPRGLPAPLAGSLCPHPPLRGQSEPGPRHPSSLALRRKQGALEGSSQARQPFWPWSRGPGQRLAIKGEIPLQGQKSPSWDK